MVIVPSSAAVGSPDDAPVPAAAATPCSVVPLAVFAPAPPPALLPPPVRASRRPRWVFFLPRVAPVAPVAPVLAVPAVAAPADAPVPIKVEMAFAASTAPPP